MEIANARLGIKITEENTLKVFGNKIIPLDKGDKWFIPRFIGFQYGELNYENRVHKSIIDILKKEGAYEGLTRPTKGSKDKDKDMDKDKDIIGKRFKPPTLDQVIAYCKDIKATTDPKKFFNHYESAGWIKANKMPIKNWKATVRTWEDRKEPIEKGAINAL